MTLPPSSCIRFHARTFPAGEKSHSIHDVRRDRQRRSRHVGGFALVVTISLMVLLTIIAVGLLSLSAISLRSSSQSMAQAEARANARLALTLAIGQLQSELGSDSRISAPHGLVGGEPSGQPHWTAVYDAWKAPNPSDNQPDTPESRSVTFREWLVSGSVGASPPSAPVEILMVGPGSLGADIAPQDQVRVPSHNLNADAGNGRIAWWTSDEGMKAKINAGPDTITPATAENPLFHAQSPPHPDPQAFPVLKDFKWDSDERRKAVTFAQANLAAGLGVAGLGSAFHDLTVHSAGVLADVRTGRLKRDLSQLLSRPIAELADKPLYVSDGRMNRFDITADGVVSNRPFVGSWFTTKYKAGEWGINLEELSLFHNIHREVNWAGGVPALETKSSPDAIALDRFQIYRRHVIEAMQFIFSMQAVQSGGTTAAPTYRMQLMLDGMIVLSNPNDVRLVFPPDLVRYLDLQGMPYDAKLKITKTNGSVEERTVIPPSNSTLFNGYIEGGFGGTPAGGFQLEPGEAAVFGSTAIPTSGFNLNLRRGFNPSGGVPMTWNINGKTAALRVQMENLSADDVVEFEFVKNTEARNSGQANTYFQAFHGATGTPGRRIFESANLTSSNAPDDILMNSFLPPRITIPQSLKVGDYIVSPGNPRPKPVMLFSILRNVEQNSGGANPDALPSRHIMLGDPALGSFPVFRNTIPDDLHKTQMIFSAKPLNFSFETLAAGVGGGNAYHGGARQPAAGGELRSIRRRIPLAPPLSIGAFENAIAGGLSAHYGDPAVPTLWGRVGPGVDPTMTGLNSSLGEGSFSYPFIAKAIGNSYTNPFLAPGQIHRPSTGTGTRSRAATDPSWMVNTALWDSWFLSGIVDGSSIALASPMKDQRTTRAQFKDLAEGTGLLRNARYRFHPHKSAEAALEDLFSGEEFKGSALNALGNYLLIDGAFNVNSTSVEAWAAMFRSVAGQKLLVAGGEPKKFDNPYGTLGYAASEATFGQQGDWSGLRNLTNTQITDLARATVEEVKARGPFLSMADFVNRRPNDGDPAHQAVGALQAAIDKSGLNDRFKAGNRQIMAADFNLLPGRVSVKDEPAPARAVGAAGHLRQANLLTALGSQISVRSDTFVIRAYGDSRDKSGKNVLASAYCEAVVQRIPEFIDLSDSPEVAPVSPVNQLFGRSFRTLSFRWLSPSEI